MSWKGSRVVAVTTAPAIVRVFHRAGKTWGFPAPILTDNGCVYAAWHRDGATALETELLALGIRRIRYRRSVRAIDTSKESVLSGVCSRSLVDALSCGVRGHFFSKANRALRRVDTICPLNGSTVLAT